MSHIKNKKFHKIALILSITSIAIMVGIISFGNENITEAQEPSATPDTKELSGYAWSPNIGWISMNCSNTGTCLTSKYGVTLDEETGDLTGEAWSSNVGWLQFGGYDTADFPVDSSTQSINANIDTDNGSMNGWARFLGFGDDVLIENCSDGIQNQDETGVDIGGICEADSVFSSESEYVNFTNTDGIQTWTVPPGVFKIMIRASGGGGGGGSYSDRIGNGRYGRSGEPTVVSGIVTAYGGLGGGSADQGSYYEYFVPRQAPSAFPNVSMGVELVRTYDVNVVGNIGNGQGNEYYSDYGVNVTVTSFANGIDAPSSCFGCGGGGISGHNIGGSVYETSEGGGSSRATLVLVDVTPGQVISMDIGDKGLGGVSPYGGYRGGNGGQGVVEIYYNKKVLAWDGWVSLSGQTTDNSTYGPTRTGDTISGYAWGDDVVGWIDFSGVSLSESPAQCGTANAINISTKPVTDFCDTGTLSGVVSQADQDSWTWTCLNESSSAQCSASCSINEWICGDECISTSETCGNNVCPIGKIEQPVGSGTCEVDTGSCPAGQIEDPSNPGVCIENTGSYNGDITAFIAQPRIINSGEECSLNWAVYTETPATVLCEVVSGGGDTIKIDPEDGNLDNVKSGTVKYENVTSSTNYTMSCYGAVGGDGPTIKTKTSTLLSEETARCVINPNFREF